MKLLSTKKSQKRMSRLILFALSLQVHVPFVSTRARAVDVLVERHNDLQQEAREKQQEKTEREQAEQEKNAHMQLQVIKELVEECLEHGNPEQAGKALDVLATIASKRNLPAMNKCLTTVKRSGSVLNAKDDILALLPDEDQQAVKREVAQKTTRGGNIPDIPEILTLRDIAEYILCTVQSENLGFFLDEPFWNTVFSVLGFPANLVFDPVLEAMGLPGFNFPQEDTVLGCLQSLKNTFTETGLDEICEKFEDTWTILQRICDKIEDIEFDLDVLPLFQQTWTAIQESTEIICGKFEQQDIDLCDKFEQTWTAIKQNTEIVCGKFEDTWTILDFVCDKIDNDFNFKKYFEQTWTAVEEVEINLCKKFEQTWTMLACVIKTPIFGPTVITEPGVYCLANDILVKDPDSCGIVIDSSDVVLDLGDQNIIGMGGAYGVCVEVDRENVEIKNGTIRDMTDCGILAKPGGHKIFIDHCTIYEHGGAGIVFDQVTNGHIQACDLCGNTTGIYLHCSHGNIIEDCVATHNSVVGYEYQKSNKNCTRDCKAIENGSGGPFTDACITEGGDAFGYLSNSGECNIFEGCIAEGTRSTANAAAYHVAGFCLTGHEFQTHIINCIASNSVTSTAGDTIPYGIKLDSLLQGLELCSTAQHGDNCVFSVKWSPDGAYLAMGGEPATDTREIRVFAFDPNTKQLTQVATADHDSNDILSIDWSPDGVYLAVGGDTANDNKEIRVFEFDKNAQTLTQVTTQDHGNNSAVNSVAWSPDGCFLATGGSTPGVGDGKEIRVFEFDKGAKTLTQVDAKDHDIANKAVHSVDWSPDGAYLAIGGDTATGTDSKEIRVFSFDTNTKTLTLLPGANQSHGNSVRSVKWSPDGCYLAMGGESAAGYEIRIFAFDCATETLILCDSRQHDVAPKTIFSIDWSPDGRLLAIGGSSATNSDSKEIRVFKFSPNTKSLTLSQSEDHGNQRVFSVNWSPDGTILAVGGDMALVDDSEIRLFGVSFFGPSKSLIKDNTINGISGGGGGIGLIGVNGELNNLIINNLAFCNDINYKFIPNVYDKGLFCKPLPFDNICFPPFDGDCPDDGELVDIICDKFEQTWTVLQDIRENLCEICFDEGLLGKICEKLEQTFSTFACGGDTTITGPTVITEPGCYCVPTGFDVTSGDGICVDADDVKIDLNGKTLVGDGGDNGIVIKQGHCRVTVCNGTIINMNEHGIKVEKDTKSITIEDIKVAGCTHGLKTCGVPGPKNMHILNSSFCDNTEYGLWLDYARNTKVKWCDMSSNGYGMCITNGEGNVVEHCCASDNDNDGFNLCDSNKNCFRECKAINNGSDGTAHGFVTKSGMCNVFNDCVAECTKTEGTCQSMYAAGFAFLCDERKSQIINSMSSNVSTVTGSCAQAYGILIDCCLSELEPCATAEHANNAVFGLDWSPNGLFVGMAGEPASTDGKEVRVFEFDEDTKDYLEVDNQDYPGDCDAFAYQWSPSGECAAVGGSANGGSEVILYSFDQGTKQLTQEDTASHGADVRSVSWSPDNQFLAIGGATGAGGYEVRVFSVNGGAKTLTLIPAANTTHGATVYAVDWSSDGAYLAIGGAESGTTEVRVYEFNAGAGTLTLRDSKDFGGTARSVHWSPCDCFLAVGGGDDCPHDAEYEIRVYSFDEETKQLTLEDSQEHDTGESIIHSVNWSSNGRYLAAGGITASNTDGKEIRVYQLDPNTGSLSLVDSLDLDNAPVYAVDWSPSSKHLATGGDKPLDSQELRVFGILLECPEKCVIKNNMISGVSGGDGLGTGICVAPCAPEHNCLIINNLAYCNDVNYKNVPNVYDGGLFCQPGPFDNVCFPPFVTTCTDPLLEALCDKFEQTWTAIAESTEIICDKFEDLDESVCDKFEQTWTAIKENTEIVCDKFEELEDTVCEKFENTWTFINAVEERLCVKIENIDQEVNIELQDEFEQTWTAIKENTEIVCRKFEETWTFINAVEERLCVKIENIDQEVNIELQDEFQQTWTAIKENTEIVCRKFEDTWTVLQEISDGISCDLDFVTGGTGLTPQPDIAGNLPLLNNMPGNTFGTDLITESLTNTEGNVDTICQWIKLVYALALDNHEMLRFLIGCPGPGAVPFIN